MKHPKTKKLIPIEGHLRKTPGGEVTQVDTHFALREINVDDMLKSFHNDAKDLRKELLDDNGNLKVHENIAAEKLLKLYTHKGNGVDDGDLRNFDNAIPEILKQASSVHPTMMGYMYDRKLMKSMNTRGLVDLMTNPEFITQTHNTMKDIKKQMGLIGNAVETGKWLDPFSFDFQVEGNNYTPTRELQDKLREKNIFKSLEDSCKQHSDIVNRLFIDEFSISSGILRTINDGLSKNRKYSSMILPSLLLPNVLAWDDMISSRTKYLDTHSYHPGKTNSGEQIIGKEFARELINSGVIFGDVNDARKRTLSAISKSDTPVVNGEELSNYIKYVDDKHLFPALNVIAKRGYAPLQLSTNDRLLGDLQQTSERIRGLTENVNKKETVPATASKNPFAILTMSPNNPAPSCQSIVNETGKSIMVNSLNANVWGTINSHKTNDFIIFKNNSDGEKAARISLNHDNNIFKHFEDDPIYGDGKKERDTIDSVMRAMNSSDNNVVHDNRHGGNVVFFTDTVTTKLSDLNKHVKSLSTEKRTEFFNSEKQSQMQDEVFNELNGAITNSMEYGFNNTGYSQLYHSAMHLAIPNAENIIQEVKNTISSIRMTKD